MGKLLCLPVLFFLSALQASGQKQTISLRDSIRINYIKTVPADFYSKHLGLFCQQELFLQKTSGLNLFFRLGSKEYVDRKEGKVNGITTY